MRLAEHSAKKRSWTALFKCAGVCISLTLARGAYAGLPPEVQPAVRAATFEVILKKPEKDPLTYEKPLPFDLEPFVERNDKYRSIGTAFALGGNRYVSAGHVFEVAINSQSGAPALRSSDGKVYAIDRILKFSIHGDFVVFSLSNDPAPTGLVINRSPKIDAPVFAVGNALGEGIVIRDGLFTSETSEEQDGSWKWIRFSAAASPGNSGGPLLDANGEVIGIVLRKSANENLNYSLPIGLAVDAEAKAIFDQRLLMQLPFMRGTRTYSMKDEFRLPLTWPDFQKAFESVINRHDDESIKQLFSAYAATQFAEGKGVDDILYGKTDASLDPSLILQQPDDTWLAASEDYKTTSLPDDGFLNVASEAGASLLHLHRSNYASDDAFYSDSKAFMDVALRGLDFKRRVGGDDIRITSLGAAQSDSMFTDHYGRVWQERVWAMPYRDADVIAVLLPSPDGYYGLIKVVPSFALRASVVRLRQLTDQFSVSYGGTPAQWQAFLKRSSLVPRPLSSISLTKSPDWTVRSARFETHLVNRVFPMSEQGQISMVMNYVSDGPHLIWDLVGVWWFAEADGKSSVGLWRLSRPPKSAKLEYRTAFADVAARHAPYDGEAMRASADTFAVSRVLDVPGTQPGKASADLLYGITVHLAGATGFQDLNELSILLVAGTRIIEHGAGEDTELYQVAAPQQANEHKALFSIAAAHLVADGASDAIYGQDIRGRFISQDYRDYVVSTDATKALDQPQAAERAKALVDYWRVAKGVAANRNLWGSFLERNQLPADQSHSAPVTEAQEQLERTLDGKDPGPEWPRLAQNLVTAYVNERAVIARSLSAGSPSVFVARKSGCPANAAKRSETEKPAIAPLTRSPNEFYPNSTRRAQIQGLVIVAVQVDASGCGRKMGIVASSGSEDLDQAALDFMDTAEFYPAQRQGQAVDGIYKTVVKFQFAQ